MKRWWGIRHVRYWLTRRQVAQRFTAYGAHAYLIVSLEDMALLGQIWRGEA